MKIKLLLLILIITNPLKAQRLSTTDSLINQQIIAITKSYRESRNLTQQLEQINKKNDLYINTNQTLSIKIDSIEKKLESLKKHSPLTAKEKENSATDWITAVGAFIGIFGIVKLFLKDKATEKKVNSLESIASTQNNINEKFNDQIQELKLQTKEFYQQTQLMSNQNIMTERSLKIELEQHEYSTYKKYEELEEYFIETLRAFKTPIENQANIFKEFSEKLKEKKIVDYQLEIKTSFLMENLEKIKHTDLYKIFVSNREGNKEEKLKAFHELSASIDYIKLYKPTIKVDYDEYLKKYSEYQDYWKMNIGDIQAKYDEWLNEHKLESISREQDPFFFEFHRIVINWYKNSENPEVENFRDPYFLMTNYVEPLKELCNRMPDPRASYLIPLIVKCSHAIKEHDHLKEIYSVDYERNYKVLIDIKNTLETSLNQLLSIEKVRKMSMIEAISANIEETPNLDDIPN